MSLRAIAALFSKPDEATQVFDELKAAGFGRVEISALDANVPDSDAPAEAYDVAREPSGSSERAAPPFFLNHDSPASSFQSELNSLGFTHEDARLFVAGVLGGGSLVTVDAAPDPGRAHEILTRFAADVREAGAPERSVAERSMPGDGLRDDGDGSGEAALQLRAERLEVNKRVVRHGQAAVRKETITEMRSIEVPVVREELVIERQPVPAGSASSEPLGESQEIRIPLSEERVSVEKHPVVIEEVEIGTRRVQEMQHVTDSVRHEELRVERSDGAPKQAS